MSTSSLRKRHTSGYRGGVPLLTSLPDCSSSGNVSRGAPLQACDFFDLFVFSEHLTGCFHRPQKPSSPEPVTFLLWHEKGCCRRKGWLSMESRPRSPTTTYPSATILSLSATLSFLSSRAYPDFLLHRPHRRPRMWFSSKRTTRSRPKPQFSTGNPGEAERICGAPFGCPTFLVLQPLSFVILWPAIVGHTWCACENH
jgi:hypothetical protein